MIKAILLDIEGTTTPISFVHDVLFPFARQRMGDFLKAHTDDPDVAPVLQDIADITGMPLTPDQTLAQLHHWMDQDQKITPLKALQGMIWRQGYESGQLQGDFYPDAIQNIRRWFEQGKRLYIYSSGSVEAQQLIFGHSVAGDLRPFIRDYFDTRIGNKREAAAYRSILESIELPGSEVLFLSDIGEELDAARTAGLLTCQLLRDTGAIPAMDHPQVSDFDAVTV
ncbi:MAG: acireductone synthase [Zetaproteobacteria bacterium CG_4_9_14_3_um_filter_49_83]|nr:MAG: acireductone synthase [Zetaproteobacteria bacterium CG17_big_fil_post_rev_8_21_14_2_50_50_13]PIV29284.1 MAG: acireductone synthase [Zetaproteobacteria bacterium CG02_land_8_20_14_3_00_50_9]PIY54664.1 MAG: acireductone synthase [Zetaproteobacteria bacterium CG_4_10_14_0_8_um_filter_49_80]PJA35605.1 MAG: acireductone synthase [Zetaproteobacteria bacterium CG_4_9_14_3_um_filter_49_83]